MVSSAGALTGVQDPPIFNDDDRRDKFYDFLVKKTGPRHLVDVLRRLQIPVKPVVHVAINWVLKQEGITVALVGARTPEQAIRTLELVNGPCR